MTKEVWKPVKGYEGSYEVSDLGNVRSLDREVEKSNGQVYRCRGKELAKIPEVGGYLRVGLYIKGKISKLLIHRLVLEAFVGECPEGMETRHLDGDPTNNRLSNLVWGTSQENTWDIVAMGNHRCARQTHCSRQHPLKGSNLHKHKRRRICKACRQAYLALYRIGEHKNERMMQEESDARYYKIVQQVALSQPAGYNK